MGTVRITGNWRNPNKKEWLGAPEVDADGCIDRSLEIPEEVYQAIERQIAQGNVEGTVAFDDGRKINWFYDG